MRRKVVKHGPSSLTISLPTDWVKKFNIKKGDELSVKEYGKELKIYPEEIKNKEEKKEINIGSHEKVGKTSITGAYRQGYDHIEVKFDNPEYIKSIQHIFQQVMGFEIIKQTQNKCEIKDLTGHVKDEFEAVQRRLWLLMLDLVEESLEAIEKRDLEWIDRIKSKDYTINRFSNYCLRHLVKQGYSDPKKTPQHYYAIKSIEEIGDCYKDTCLAIKERNIKLNKDEIEIMKELNECINKIYEVWYSYNKEDVEELYSKLRDIEKKINSNETNIPYMQAATSKMRDILSVMIQLNL